MSSAAIGQVALDYEAQLDMMRDNCRFKVGEAEDARAEAVGMIRSILDRATKSTHGGYVLWITSVEMEELQDLVSEG